MFCCLLMVKFVCFLIEGINLCSLAPCKNQGQCIALGTSYACMCHGNWTGPNCETKIVKDEVCNATDVNAMSHKYTTIFLVNEPFFFEPIFLIKLTLTLFLHIFANQF